MSKKLDYLQNYFFVIYDSEDNYINSYDNIDSLGQLFNKPIKKIIYNIRNNMCIEKDNNLYKVYMFKKSKMIVSKELRETIKLFAKTGRRNETRKITTGRHI